MRSLSSFSKIFLYAKPVDMRKQSYGLSQVVFSEIGHDFSEDYLYLFSNRARNTCRMIYFDRTGYAVWSKKLEKNRFPWKFEEDKNTFTFDEREVSLLLQGINIFKDLGHSEVLAKSVL